jgi:hypothetical protein
LCRCLKKNPTIGHFKHTLTFQRSVEKHIATCNNNLHKWSKKWDVLKL